MYIIKIYGSEEDDWFFLSTEEDVSEEVEGLKRRDIIDFLEENDIAYTLVFAENYNSFFKEGE